MLDAFTQTMLEELRASLNYGDRKTLAHLMAERHGWKGDSAGWHANLCHMLEGRKSFRLTDADLIYQVIKRDVVTPLLQLRCLQIAEAAKAHASAARVRLQ